MNRTKGMVPLMNMSTTPMGPLRDAVLRDGRSQRSITRAPGWRLTFLAGFVPLLTGVWILATHWFDITHPDAAWWIGFGNLDFTYASLDAVGTQAQPLVEMLGSVGSVNIVAAALGVIVVSRVGLRSGQRWAWWFLAFCFVWVDLHDATEATRFFLATGQPVMAMPISYCALMLGGLLRSWRAVFRASAPQQIA